MLWSTFSVTLVRTALVVDGVREDNGRQGVVLRVAKWLRTRESHKLPSRGQNAQLARSGDGDGGGGSGSRRAPRSKNSDMQLRYTGFFRRCSTYLVQILIGLKERSRCWSARDPHAMLSAGCLILE